MSTNRNHWAYMTEKLLLRRAAERHTKSPCREAFARTADGRSVSPEHRTARAWCAIGAVRAELPRDPQRMDAVNCLNAAARVYGFDSVADANDNASDLMPDIWSEAIEMDEAQPLTGKALLAARAYDARRRAMIASGVL
jgi:hypothetical protein